MVKRRTIAIAGALVGLSVFAFQLRLGLERANQLSGSLALLFTIASGVYGLVSAQKVGEIDGASQRLVTEPSSVCADLSVIARAEALSALSDRGLDTAGRIDLPLLVQSQRTAEPAIEATTLSNYIRREANSSIHRTTIVGEAGSGKSALAYLLIVGICDQRQELEPVPILLRASEWDPRELAIENWLVRTVEDKLSTGRNKSDGTANDRHTLAQELVRQGRVFPVVDGLDEVHAVARQAASEQVSRFWSDHVANIVVTSRADAAWMLVGRTSLDLQVTVEPLVGSQILSVLRRWSESRNPGWIVLADYLDEHPESVVWEALASPLMLNVANEVYAGSPLGPIDIANGDLFRTKSDVESHLLEGLVGRQFMRLEDGENRGQFAPLKARRWVEYLAKRLARDGYSRLDWVEFTNTTRFWLPWTFDGGVDRREVRRSWVSPRSVFPTAPLVRLRRRARFFVTGSLGIAGRLFLLSLVLSWFLALLPASSARLDSSGTLMSVEEWLDVGVLTWVWRGVVFAIGFRILGLPRSAWCVQSKFRHRQIDLWSQVVSDRNVFMVNVLSSCIFGILVCLALPIFAWSVDFYQPIYGQADWLQAAASLPSVCVALTFTAFALLFDLSDTAWVRFRIPVLVLSLLGDLPLRIKLFLDQMCDIGVLRLSAGGYEFRHLRIQQHFDLGGGLDFERTRERAEEVAQDGQDGQAASLLEAISPYDAQARADLVRIFSRLANALSGKGGIHWLHWLWIMYRAKKATRGMIRYGDRNAAKYVAEFNLSLSMGASNMTALEKLKCRYYSPKPFDTLLLFGKTRRYLPQEIAAIAEHDPYLVAIEMAAGREFSDSDYLLHGQLRDLMTVARAVPPSYVADAELRSSFARRLLDAGWRTGGWPDNLDSIPKSLRRSEYYTPPDEWLEVVDTLAAPATPPSPPPPPGVASTTLGEAVQCDVHDFRSSLGLSIVVIDALRRATAEAGETNTIGTGDLLHWLIQVDALGKWEYVWEQLGPPVDLVGLADLPVVITDGCRPSIFGSGMSPAACRSFRRLQSLVEEYRAETVSAGWLALAVAADKSSTAALRLVEPTGTSHEELVVLLSRELLVGGDNVIWKAALAFD